MALKLAASLIVFNRFWVNDTKIFDFQAFIETSGS